MKGDPRSAGTRAEAMPKRPCGAIRRKERDRSARQLAGAKFRREQPIGRYGADFCCVEARLIVAVDGGQHAEQAPQDAERTAYLGEQGWRVVRFWNHDVLARTGAVLEAIARELAQPLDPARKN